MKINSKSFGIFILSMFSLVSWLLAQNPQLLNYQGKLTNPDGTPANGTYTITFRIYPDTSTQNDKWLEEHKNVQVMNGIFNVLLGSIKGFGDLFTQPGDLYLGIIIDKIELKPRFRLTSVPYAMHANSANLAQALVGSPVIGRWYATNHVAAGPINYQWGTEILNTDPSCLARAASDYEIVVKKAGYYLICVNVLQGHIPSGERAHVRLTKNNEFIACSLGPGDNLQNCKHTLSIIESFNVGDRISVFCEDHVVYAHPSSLQWSRLDIYKLN